EREERGQPTGRPLRVAALIQLSIAVAVAVIFLLARVPLEDKLFDGNSTLYWVLVVTVTCFGASYYARGYLAGTRRFGLLAGLLLNEALGRFLLALAVAVGIAEGQTAFALGVAISPLLSLLVVPLAFVGTRGRSTPRVTAAPSSAPTGPEFTLASGGG